MKSTALKITLFFLFVCVCFVGDIILRPDNHIDNPAVATSPVNIRNINIISPSMEHYMGEKYIAEDLAEYFQKKGKNVKIFSKEQYEKKKNFRHAGSSVNIFLYGGMSISPNRNGINIIYMLYPAFVFHNTPAFSYEPFDLIAVASQTYIKTLKQKGFKTTYIPQFSNPKRFKFEPKEKLKTNVLFIGNAMRFDVDFRPSVAYAIQNNIPVDVYGQSWDKYIDKKYIKGTFIENNDLNKYYSSAKIILNDHRPDMKKDGFISNRIFDATASNAFIISDYMPEIKRIYGNAIPMYHNQKDFGKLVSYYLAHPEERQKKADKAHKITMQHFTVEKIGERFLEEIEKITKEKKDKGVTIIDE